MALSRRLLVALYFVTFFATLLAVDRPFYPDLLWQGPAESAASWWQPLTAMWLVAPHAIAEVFIVGIALVILTPALRHGPASAGWLLAALFGGQIVAIAAFYGLALATGVQTTWAGALGWMVGLAAYVLGLPAGKVVVFGFDLGPTRLVAGLWVIAGLALAYWSDGTWLRSAALVATAVLAMFIGWISARQVPPSSRLDRGRNRPGHLKVVRSVNDLLN